MKASIIGTGRIGFLLENDTLRYHPCTHMGAIEVLRKKKNDLHWGFLCDTDEARLQAASEYVARRKNEPPVNLTDNYNEVFKKNPDLLVISSPTDTHFEILMKAMEFQIPAIVVEKPVAMNHSEARKIQKKAVKTRSKIWVNYERRYHYKYQKLREIAEGKNKKLGHPVYFRSWFASPHHKLYRNSGGEGILLHDTTHLVDLVQYIFGPVKNVDSVVSKNPQFNKDPVFHQIGITCTSGVSGEILTTGKSQFFHLELEIIFTGGRVRAGNGFLEFEYSEESRYYKNFFSLGNGLRIEDKKMSQSLNPFLVLYRDVLAGRSSLQNLADACENVRLLS